MKYSRTVLCNVRNNFIFIIENCFTFLNDYSWKDEVDEFANCILNDLSIINGSSHDALKVMEMIFDIYESDKTWWKIFNNN